MESIQIQLDRRKLVDQFDRLTVEVGAEKDPAFALSIVQKAYSIVDENVALPGLGRFERLPEEAIAVFHSAVVEHHLGNEAVSDLAKKLWERATVGYPMPATVALRSTLDINPEELSRRAFIQSVGCP